MKTTHDFGRTLRRLRRDRDLTQKKLASIINVTQQQITHYETGRNEPEFNTIIALADFFEISLDELFGRKAVNK